MSAAEQIEITRWPSLTVVKGRREATTWRGLIDALSSPIPRREKTKLPGWAPATFANDTRAKEGVERVSLLAYDVDNATSADKIEAALRSIGCEAFAHPSPSSTPTTQRWRVLLRASRHIMPAEFPAAWDAARSLLARQGVAVDSATRDPSRLWFVPCDLAEGPFETIAIDGAPLDVDGLIAATATPEPEPRASEAAASEPPSGERHSSPPAVEASKRQRRYARGALDRACAKVTSAPEGKRNAILNDESWSIGRLVAAGHLEDGNARTELRAAGLAAALTESEVDATIASAFSAAQRSPRDVPPRTEAGGARTANAPKLARLGDALAASIVRAERRADGKEKPITLPWPSLADHFGGGLWPGLHIINKGTGVGGTQFALQVALGAAKRDVPALYIGLELGDLDLALRLLGEEAHVPWSSLWTGKAGPEYLRRVREAAPVLAALPFFYEVSRPHGFAPSALLASVEALRAAHPEADGPGSRPMLVVVDFLQLIGDEPNDEQETRTRVGRAAYVLRDAANRLGASVLCISSIARERYKTLSEIHAVAGLTFDLDADGCPVARRILDKDAIVGMGKESGEIEFSADSVSVLAKVAATWDGKGCDVVFATPKGRATGETWSALHFTGFRYEECSDRGGRVVAAWNEAGEARERAKEERRGAKEQAKLSAVDADASAVRAYVAEHPGCNVREARMHAVSDSARRWGAAVAKLGAVLVQRKDGKRVALYVAGAEGADASP